MYGAKSFQRIELVHRIPPPTQRTGLYAVSMRRLGRKAFNSRVSDALGQVESMGIVLVLAILYAALDMCQLKEGGKDSLG
ncbi:hypothetical protein T440DRAFT_463281 [Plenodomus tracheiphilus IPT5]|uniref:Uncharacterized protein n=1 Tax=Plenodomus tracheiphilus IPT5 TaxID=1408161 RepID=A0A6A7BMA6_9PLEO|nr:hypothetical protein T440DRAFT_463281 [Plenodomus tracheiphilus IPT5]